MQLNRAWEKKRFFSQALKTTIKIDGIAENVLKFFEINKNSNELAGIYTDVLPTIARFGAGWEGGFN